MQRYTIVTSLSPFAVFERTVTPASPAQLIVDLIELLRRRALPAAMEARLVASLEAALVNPRKVSLTCSVLSRFIALVQVGAAQKFIPVARATELITRARAITTALGC